MKQPLIDHAWVPYLNNLCGKTTSKTGQRCGHVRESHVPSAHVILFRLGGKYYTEEYWRIPDEVPHEGDLDKMRPVIGPYDMLHSPDFRRIDGGAVLVETQEPWGYPFLLMP